MGDKPSDKNGKDDKSVTDKDAMDMLPLSMIPLSSNTLKSARLVKNSRMQTAVELHSNPVTGSLQIMPEDVDAAYGGNERDRQIILQLSQLHSFDVYSLRGSLKKLGIEVIDPSALELSDVMKKKLEQYTVLFTRPLIENIFGAGRVEANSNDSLQMIFRDPDVTRVRENLRVMTTRTGIPLDEIPKFIEDYSEVFLSVAYYRFSFEGLLRDVERFVEWINLLKGNREVASSASTLASCKKVEDKMRFLMGSVHARLNKFQDGFEVFWHDINQKSFVELRHQIEENHTSMGSVLCGLLVKMRGWSSEFPDNTVGGPAKKVKYLLTEFEPGIQNLVILENEARFKLGLPLVKA